MRKSLFYVLVAIIFILGAFSPAISSAQAQTPPPPREPERQQPCLPGQPCKDENGEQFIIPTEETLAAPNAIGDSDDYGYTLSAALNIPGSTLLMELTPASIMYMTSQVPSRCRLLSRSMRTAILNSTSLVRVT